MNNETFLQVQILELRRLMEKATDDPLLRPQLEERLKHFESELENERKVPGCLLPRETPLLPRAAFFLRGGDDVSDSEGIRPALAGEVLIQYEKMFVEQALHDERTAARAAGRDRRPRGSPHPALLFTGTPRGSFGFEFVAQFHQDAPLLDLHATALDSVAKAIVRVTEADATSRDNVVNDIPTRVLQPLKQFLKTVAQHGAELRLAFPDRPAQSLPNEKLKEAADLLERDVEEGTITVRGTFRGATLDSGYFDLRTEEGNVLSGYVADELTDDKLEQMNSLLNKSCKARLQKTTVRKVTGQAVVTYVLLDAEPT